MSASRECPPRRHESRRTNPKNHPNRLPTPPTTPVAPISVSHRPIPRPERKEFCKRLNSICIYRIGVRAISHPGTEGAMARSLARKESPLGCGRERGDEHARSRNNATVGISGDLRDGAGTRALRPRRVAQAEQARRRRQAVSSSPDRRSGFLRPRQEPSLATAAGRERGASAGQSPRWRPARKAVIPGFPVPEGGLAAAAKPNRIRSQARTGKPAPARQFPESASPVEPR